MPNTKSAIRRVKRTQSQTSINRISLYYYNTKKEIDIFCEKLAEVIDILN